MSNEKANQPIIIGITKPLEPVLSVNLNRTVRAKLSAQGVLAYVSYCRARYPDYANLWDVTAKRFETVHMFEGPLWQFMLIFGSAMGGPKMCTWFEGNNIEILEDPNGIIERQLEQAAIQWEDM